MADDLLPDKWYNPYITNPDFGIQPIDLDFRRGLYRAVTGLPPAVALPLRARAEQPLADSPWLLAAAGFFMLKTPARAIIDDVAWPGDVRWLPLAIETPTGPVNDYQVIAPSLDGGDFLYEPRTTRDPRGAPIRWVLDSTKLGDRHVLMVPGLAGDGLVMRGRVLQRLLDLGAKGIVIERARVMPPAP